MSKNADRVSSILKAPIPNTVSELRPLFGMFNYYSKFIDNFAEKMHPLHELFRKDSKFVWSQTCQNAYETLKQDITSDQVLRYFDPNLPIVLTTGESNHAVAGILSYRLSDGSVRTISQVSRALSKSELNYSTLEKEALAIIFSITKLRE